MIAARPAVSSSRATAANVGSATLLAYVVDEHRDLCFQWNVQLKQLRFIHTTLFHHDVVAKENTKKQNLTKLN